MRSKDDGVAYRTTTEDMTPYRLVVLRPIEVFSALPGDVLSIQPGGFPAVVLGRELPPNFGVIAGALADNSVTSLLHDDVSVRAVIQRLSMPERLRGRHLRLVSR